MGSSARCMVSLRTVAAALAVVTIVCGCASQAPRTSESIAPIFYPALPDQPRLQFLARFSTEADLATKSSALQDFVLGAETSGSDLLVKPYGVDIHDQAIFVVDTRNSGWAVFDLAQRRTRVVRPSGAGALRKPINISIDADGTRYVTDTGRDQVVVFDANDRYLRAFGKAGEFQPVDAVVSGDRLYVTDIAHHQVVVLNKHTGVELRRFGAAGSGDGQLFQPTNLAIDAAGDVYVTDTGNFRVQKFSPDGQLRRSFGRIGTVAGQFARPKGIAVDRSGRLYVGDAAFENIQLLDADGNPLLYMGGPGDGRDSINLPAAITVDYANVGAFQQYAAPGFMIDYVVLVASQFGVNKIVAFGFGSYRQTGADVARPAASQDRR